MLFSSQKTVGSFRRMACLMRPPSRALLLSVISSPLGGEPSWTMRRCRIRQRIKVWGVCAPRSGSVKEHSHTLPLSEYDVQNKPPQRQPGVAHQFFTLRSRAPVPCERSHSQIHDRVCCLLPFQATRAHAIHPNQVSVPQCKGKLRSLVGC